MPKYSYKAVSLDGENISGDYLSPDRDGVIGMLRQGGYYPVSIMQLNADDRTTKKKIKIKPLSGFCSQMAAMLGAGVPIAKTLEILGAQTDNAALRKILNDVYSKVQQGNSLYDSFLPYRDNFPTIFMNMIEAGEATGRLDMCMERAGISFSRSAKLDGKLKAAMVYPAVLLTLMIGIVVLLLIFVIPTFVDLFESYNAELPALTQALVDLSDYFVRRWYLILSVAASIVMTIKLILDSDAGRTAFDRFKLRAPVLGKLLMKVYAARYARTLSSLNAAGVPLTQALTVTARSIINRYIEKGLYKVVDAVNQGEELSAPLERMSSLPPMIVYMTRLGEESGTMDALLDQAADFYDNESEAALQMLTAMLEPMMIILMAILVLPVVLAIIQPVFNMYNTMV